MDKDTLKQALDEMRKDLRGRVGKKLLSIEVKHHAGDEPLESDDESRDSDGSVKGDDVESRKQRQMGVSIFGT